MTARREISGEGRQVVVIVGGTSGIGRATALRFAAAGAHLALIARSAESLGDTRADCERAGASSVSTHACDAARAGEVATAVDTVAEQHGRVDLVVHTASVMAYGVVEAVPGEVFDQVVDTAIHGTREVVQAALAIFRRQGRGTLVVVNSLLGTVTVPGMGAYATAKWGQRALVRTVQQELRGDRSARHIRVCLVTPGSINTPIYDQAANYVGRAARPPWPVLSPEQVATVIARLAVHPRNNVSFAVGVTNPVIRFGFTVLPFVYDRLVPVMFRLLALTRHRIGPHKGNVRVPNPAGDRVHGRWPDRH